MNFSFTHPEFLTLLPLVLLPWIVYFLRLFSGEIIQLPSLIFLFESVGASRLRKIPWLIYLLQSLAILFLIMAFARPQLSSSEKSFYCVADDLVHTQWTLPKWRRVATELQKTCDGTIFSLAEILNNRESPVNPAKLRRSQPWLPLQALEFIRSRRNNRPVLWIQMDHDFRFQNVDSPVLNHFRFYTVPPEEKQNHYLESVLLRKDPLHYEKRFIRVQVAPPGKYKVAIKTARNSILLETNPEGLLEQNLSLTELPMLSLAEISIPGDQYPEDDKAFLLLSRSRPYRLLFQGEVPVVIRAVTTMPIDRFPSFWFSADGGGSKVLMSSSRKISLLPTNKRAIYFPPADTAESGTPRRFERNALFPKAFPLNYPVRAYEIPTGLPDSKILLRFEDGSPAAVRFAQGGGMFFFHPDSAPSELKQSGTYALFLLSAILDMLSETPYQVAQSEKEWERITGQSAPRSTGVYEERKGTFVKIKTEDTSALGAKSKILVFQNHPDSLRVTGTPVPNSRKMDLNRTAIRSSFFSWSTFSIFFALAILCVGAIAFLGGNTIRTNEQ